MSSSVDRAAPSLGAPGRRAAWLTFVGQFAAQLALYLAIFHAWMFADFGIANDYSIFFYDNKKCCLGFPETSHLFWVGRPLGGILLGFHLSLLDGIASFGWARLASAVMAALTAAFVVHLLKRDSRPERGLASLFGVLVFTLPSCLLYILWLTNLVPGVASVAMAALAYAALRGPAVARAAGWRRRALIGAGVAALSAGFLIYPPGAFFYLVFTCWHAYFGIAADDRARLRRVVLDFALIVTISVVYFVLVRVATPPMMKLLFGEGRRMRPGGAYSFELSTDLPQVARAAYGYLSAASELWLVGWSGIFSLVTLGALVGAVAYGWRLWRRDAEDASRFALALFATVAAVGVASAPVIVSPSGLFVARNLFVPAALIIFLMLLTLRAVAGHGASAVLVLAAVAAVGAGYFRVGASAENASRELALVRRSLATAGPGTTDVVARPPPMGDQIVDARLYADFGHVASNHGLNEAVIRGVLRDRGVDPARVRIHIVPFGAPDPEGVPADAPVIDFADAGFRMAQARKSQLNAWTVSAPSGGPCCSPTYAFDDHPATFWETALDSPVSLKLRFTAACFSIQGYSIAAPISEIERAPRSWRLSGTNIAGATLTLDTQYEQVVWRAGEVRRFVLAQPACVQSLQFDFLAAEDTNLLRIATIELTRSDGRAD